MTEYKAGYDEGAHDAATGSFLRPERNPHLNPGRPLTPIKGQEDAAASWAFGYVDGFAETSEATS